MIIASLGRDKCNECDYGWHELGLGGVLEEFKGSSHLQHRPDSFFGGFKGSLQSVRERRWISYMTFHDGAGASRLKILNCVLTLGLVA